MPPRRTNPAQQAQNLKKFAQQQQDIQDYGHTDPSILERLGNFIGNVQKNVAARRNPPPDPNGAWVTGSKPTDTSA